MPFKPELLQLDPEGRPLLLDIHSLEPDPDNGWLVIIGLEITTTDFMWLLELQKTLSLTNCRIKGDLNLKSETIHQALYFHACSFEGLVDAEDARFKKGVTLKDCTFLKSLTLASAHVDGPLDLSDSEIYYPKNWKDLPNVDVPPYEPPPRVRSARMGGLTVNGHFRCQRLKVWGSLDLGDADINGALRLEGAQIGLKYDEKGCDEDFGGRLYLRQARINGDLEMDPFFDKEKPFVPDDPTSFETQRTIVRGTVSIGNAVIKGRLNLRGARILGCLHAITAHVEGRVLADCWLHPYDDGGKSKLLQTTFGTNSWRPEGSNKPRARTDRNPELESLIFNDATIAEAVWLKGVVTTGAVNFENARIGGLLDLSVWHARHQDDTGQHSRPSKLGMRADEESLIFKNATIGAGIILDGIHTKGRISGHNARVNGAILCRLAKESNREQTFRPHIGQNKEGRSLSLYGITLASNLDFSGARLDGAVRLRYAKISGAVIGQSIDGQGVVMGATEKLKGLYLYGAEVSGNVCCKGMKSEGYLSLELARIRGTVEFEESHFNCGRPAGLTPLTEAQNELRAKFKKEVADDEEPLASILLKRAQIENRADFQRSQLGASFLAYGATFGGDLDIRECKFAGGTATRAQYPIFELSEATIHGHLEGAGLCGFSDLIAYGLKIDSHCNLAGSNFTGELVMQDAQIGQDLTMAGTEVKGGCNMRHIVVQGHAFLRDGASVTSSEEPKIQGELNLTAARLESLHFRCSDATKWPLVMNLERAKIEKLTLGGTLNDHNRSHAQLILTQTQYKHLSLGALKRVPHHGSRHRWLAPVFLFLGLLLGGPLWLVAASFRGVWWLYKDLKGGTSSAETSAENGLHFKHIWAEVLTLMVAVLSVGIAVYALHVLDHSHDGMEAPGPVNFWLKLLVLFVMLYPLMRYILPVLRKIPECYLSQIRQDWPMLHRKFRRSFGTSGDAEANGRAVMLGMMPDFDRSVYRSMEAWLDNQGERENSARIYLMMSARELDLSERSDRSVCEVSGWRKLLALIWGWLAAPQNVRPGQANERIGIWMWTWKLIFFCLCGSGVKPGRLAGLIFLFMMFSWICVFSNPASVEHPATFSIPSITEAKPPIKVVSESEQGYQARMDAWNHSVEAVVQQQQFAWSENNGRPPGRPWPTHENSDPVPYRAEADDQWGIWDGFWVTLNVHVPLIHIWARDEWEPASSEGYFRLPGTKKAVPLHMQYETYAGIAQIVSYLTFPMLLAAIGGFYKRRAPNDVG